jgi:uncharacterized protein (DUF924 family)
MANDPREVLRFWFGEGPPYAPRQEWFRKNEAFDREIERRFGPLIQGALQGGLPEWDDSSESFLARVIVLDQFTRNVFRNTPKAFAGDAQALAIARRMVASGQDLQLEPVRRGFVYMPFEHAEEMAAQHESVRLFTRLDEESPAAEALDYAHRHREVVARFGRFPHRNAILGRESTPDELAFLQQPGSSF